LLLEGKSLEAVKLTAYGSLIGLTTALILLAPALYLLPLLYSGIRGIVVYIIALVAVLLILREKDRAGKAVLIFLLSGWLGYAILDLKALSSSQVLFPAFTGLFGLSTLLISLKNRQELMPQKEYALIDFDKGLCLSGVLGSIGGIVVGVLPSLSPSQIGVVMSEIYGGSVQRFLVSVSAINTSDAIYSLVSLYTIGNPRSGVAVMLSKIIQLDWNSFLLFVGAIASTALIAMSLHLWIGRKAMFFFSKINYRVISILVVVFMIFLVYLLTGLLGLFILFLSTLIGLMPPQLGVSRTHLMGVLIIPTILFFLGLS
jgi:putative membrane protein